MLAQSGRTPTADPRPRPISRLPDATPTIAEWMPNIPGNHWAVILPETRVIMATFTHLASAVECVLMLDAKFRDLPLHQVLPLRKYPVALGEAVPPKSPVTAAGVPEMAKEVAER